VHSFQQINHVYIFLGNLSFISGYLWLQLSEKPGGANNGLTHSIISIIAIACRVGQIMAEK
jgi:hypothetical protein